MTKYTGFTSDAEEIVCHAINKVFGKHHRVVRAMFKPRLYIPSLDLGIHVIDATSGSESEESRIQFFSNTEVSNSCKKFILVVHRKGEYVDITRIQQIVFDAIVSGNTDNQKLVIHSKSKDKLDIVVSLSEDYTVDDGEAEDYFESTEVYSN
jgi:hypothetical protein